MRPQQRGGREDVRGPIDHRAVADRRSCVEQRGAGRTAPRTCTSGPLAVATPAAARRRRTPQRSRQCGGRRAPVRACRAPGSRAFRRSVTASGRRTRCSRTRGSSATASGGGGEAGGLRSTGCRNRPCSERRAWWMLIASSSQIPRGTARRTASPTRITPARTGSAVRRLVSGSPRSGSRPWGPNSSASCAPRRRPTSVPTEFLGGVFDRLHRTRCPLDTTRYSGDSNRVTIETVASRRLGHVAAKAGLGGGQGVAVVGAIPVSARFAGPAT